MIDPTIFIFLCVLGLCIGVKVVITQNPVYSGLYLVLLFFLGSIISFLLGLEFIALLFLLIYAGAIAVLVLFVVMMLDVKSIEIPWSVEKKIFYLCALVFFLFLLIFKKDLLIAIKLSMLGYLSFLISLNYTQYHKSVYNSLESLIKKWMKTEPLEVELEIRKTHPTGLNNSLDDWYNLCNKTDLSEFFCLFYSKELNDKSFDNGLSWFFELDSSCALNDLSYLLYTTHAILLIIGGIVLLIAMVGAISLTIVKSRPEYLYKQLSRDSKNAVFSIKEKVQSTVFVNRNNLKVPHI